MSDALWNIEALEPDGTSLGVADMVSFKLTEQIGVVRFEATWPAIDEWRVITVGRIRIEGKLMDLEQPVTVSHGDTLRIRGFANGRGAGIGGKLDG